MQTETQNTQEVISTQSAGTATQQVSGPGFLDHIKVAGPSPADMPNQEVETPSTETATPAEKTAGESKSEEKTTPADTFENQKVSVRGREFTIKDLVKAYENSSDEGIRLNKLTKQLQQALAELEAKYLELQTKIDEKPPFKELSEEEIAELPIPKQVEYYTQKQKWEAEKAARKEAAEKARQKLEALEKETQEYIIARSQYMGQHPEKWPEYNELIPVMEQIIDTFPYITGYRETPDILYYTALGLKYYREQMNKKSLEEKAKQEASKQAKAQAAIVSSSGTPSPHTVTPSGEEDTDEVFAKRILSKVQKPYFSI